MVQCLSEWGFIEAQLLLEETQYLDELSTITMGNVGNVINTSPKVCSLSKCLVVYGFLTGLVA